MADEKWYLSKVYQLIGKSPKSTKEVHDWLKRRQATDEQIASILKKLQEIRLLDDQNYTHSFVRTQLLIHPQSKRQLIYKLQKKGIKSEMVKAVLEEENFDEESQAKGEIRKNSWKWEKLTGMQKKQKIITFLMRKGFQLDLIKKLVKEAYD